MAKVMNKEKMEEQDNLTLIFNSSPVGMIIINDDITISQINNAALTFIEKTYDEAVGEAFGDAFNCLGSFDDARGCGFGESCSICTFRNAIAEVVKTGEAMDSLEFNKILVKSSKRVETWFRCSITPVTIDNHRKIFVSLVDITDSKHKELFARKAQQAAEEASRVKSEFLANMSHEIRTPLNGVLGMIDLTLLTELNAEQKENLQTAKSCTNSLLNLLNDILDFSKLEANKIVIDTLEFDIQYLIEEIIKVHSSMAAMKGLALNYTFAANIPHLLIGNPNRLKQILNNLIGNAVKFTEKGKITVKIKCENMTTDYADLQFIVSDTGIGIAKEDMVKLFQNFSQVDGSITRKFGGTGLGLAISKQLVELMGGTIWAESEKGKGSHFCFNLRFSVPIQHVKGKSQANDFIGTVKPMRILLVEDNIISQQVLSRMLKEKGHSVEIAGNGLEGIKLHSMGKYDAILMDIYMPEMDGIEATKRIREKEGVGKRTPIIAVTAETMHREREHFLTLGMDEYLPKPIKMEQLFDILAQIQEKGTTAKETKIQEVQREKGIKRSAKEQNLQIVNDIADNLNILEGDILKNNFAGIEASAHKIKEYANSMDADEIKTTAFKIELSSRRGNLLETAEYAEQIKYEFETFKKSVGLQGAT